MDIIGLTITIAASVALLAGLIWMIFIRSGRPKYVSKIGLVDGTKAEVFAETEALLAHCDPIRAAKTAQAIVSALKFYPDKFSDKDVQKLEKKFLNVAVVILSDITFEKKIRTITKYAASVYGEHKDKIYSPAIPTAYVKESTILNLIQATGDDMANGAPLIHEWIHGVEISIKFGYDYGHKDLFYWTTLPNRATEIFKGLDK